MGTSARSVPPVSKVPRPQASSGTGVVVGYGVLAPPPRPGTAAKAPPHGGSPGGRGSPTDRVGRNPFKTHSIAQAGATDDVFPGVVSGDLPTLGQNSGEKMPRIFLQKTQEEDGALFGGLSAGEEPPASGNLYAAFGGVEEQEDLLVEDPFAPVEDQQDDPFAVGPDQEEQEQALEQQKLQQQMQSALEGSSRNPFADDAGPPVFDDKPSEEDADGKPKKITLGMLVPKGTVATGPYGAFAVGPAAIVDTAAPDSSFENYAPGRGK